MSREALSVIDAEPSTDWDESEYGFEFQEDEDDPDLNLDAGETVTRFEKHDDHYLVRRRNEHTGATELVDLADTLDPGVREIFETMLARQKTEYYKRESTDGGTEHHIAIELDESEGTLHIREEDKEALEDEFATRYKEENGEYLFFNEEAQEWVSFGENLEGELKDLYENMKTQSSDRFFEPNSSGASETEDSYFEHAFVDGIKTFKEIRVPRGVNPETGLLEETDDSDWELADGPIEIEIVQPQPSQEPYKPTVEAVQSAPQPIPDTPVPPPAVSVETAKPPTGRPETTLATTWSYAAESATDAYARTHPSEPQATDPDHPAIHSNPFQPEPLTPAPGPASEMKTAATPEPEPIKHPPLETPPQQVEQPARLEAFPVVSTASPEPARNLAPEPAPHLASAPDLQLVPDKEPEPDLEPPANLEPVMGPTITIEHQGTTPAPEKIYASQPEISSPKLELTPQPQDPPTNPPKSEIRLSPSLKPVDVPEPSAPDAQPPAMQLNPEQPPVSTDTPKSGLVVELSTPAAASERQDIGDQQIIPSELSQPAVETTAPALIEPELTDGVQTAEIEQVTLDDAAPQIIELPSMIDVSLPAEKTNEAAPEIALEAPSTESVFEAASTLEQFQQSEPIFIEEILEAPLAETSDRENVSAQEEVPPVEAGIAEDEALVESMSKMEQTVELTASHDEVITTLAAETQTLTRDHIAAEDTAPIVISAEATVQPPAATEKTVPQMEETISVHKLSEPELREVETPTDETPIEQTAPKPNKQSAAKPKSANWLTGEPKTGTTAEQTSRDLASAAPTTESLRTPTAAGAQFAAHTDEDEDGDELSITFETAATGRSTSQRRHNNTARTTV